MILRFAIYIVITMGILSFTNCSSPAPSLDTRLLWQTPATLPEDTAGKPHAGIAGAVSGMLGSSYLIAGGANFPEAMPWDGGKKMYHANIYIYHQTSDGKLQYVGEQGTLPVPLAYPAIAQGDDVIFVAGGETADGLTNDCFTLQYEPRTSLLLIKHLPPLPVPTAYASAFVSGDTLMVAGGENSEGTTNKVWILNINDTTAGWQQAPSLPQAVSFATLAVTKNKQGKNEWRIAGGRCRVPGSISKIFSEVFTLREGDSAWQNNEPLPYAMSAMSSTVLPDGRWFIFSGDKGETFSKVEQLLLEISTASSDSERKQLEAEKASLQRSHPGFNPNVWVWYPDAEKWMSADTIPLPPPVTTHAVFSRENIYIGSGEIRAGIRTPHILHARIQD
jgi:N-acetylneuraminate epimerase